MFLHPLRKYRNPEPTRLNPSHAGLLCGWCILSDTVDNFTLPWIPSHGDFWKITRNQNLLWLLARSAKPLAIFILSCTSIRRILNFLQIKEYFLSCKLFTKLHKIKTLAHCADDHLIWNNDFDSIAHHIFQNNKQLGEWCSSYVSSHTLEPHFAVEKYSYWVAVWLLQS